MGEFAGFVQDKLQIKLLILYLADRLIEPCPFEAFQELTMAEHGVDYFSFADCLADLVRSEHLALTDGNYTITDKGEENIRLCETTLPYTVRQDAEKNVEQFNNKLRRQSLIQAEIAPRSSGGYTLSLSLSDKLEDILSLQLLVTKESSAKMLKENFEHHAEKIYSKIIEALHDTHEDA